VQSPWRTVSGLANYQNNIHIPIIERILPNGAEVWCLVAIAYKAESGKHVLHNEEDLHNNWVRKLYNTSKNPQAALVTSPTGFTVVLRLRGAFSASQTQAFLVPHQPKKARTQISYKMKHLGDSPIIKMTPKTTSSLNL
jgi:hypothetical protein